MPRARRDEIEWLPGCYYHLYNRGAHRLSIFREETNYRYVLMRVQKYSKRYGITVIAYCLMPNHYHFLVRQEGERPAGLLVQHTFNAYSKAFNNRYGHSGTLFEGRFKALLVADDPYLLHLCRYIHANPVKDGFALSPELWPYSNYREWIGRRNGTLVDSAFVSSRFSSATAYAAFVVEYAAGRSQLPDVVRAHLENLEA